MSPQLENEKRPELEVAMSPDRMTVEQARDEMEKLGEYWRTNFVSLGSDDILLDGTWTPQDLRRIADLWDACHDEEGNER